MSSTFEFSRRGQVGMFDAAQPTPDYSAQPTRDTFNDPRFLKDLREHYGQRGLPVSVMSDSELIERMVSDGTWREMGNTVSTVRGLFEAQTATAEERERARRLQSMYDVYPNFWEEGGRGWRGFFDNTMAAIADPVNLIGGFAGRAAATTATRGALAAGATTREAKRAGLRAGIGGAARREAAIGGAVGAGVDAGMQARDVTLGVQDEYSLGRTALSGALGAGISGAIGGTIGVPAGVAGIHSGQRQFNELSGMGASGEQIGRLSNQQAADVLTDPQARDRFQAEIAQQQALDALEPEAPVAPATSARDPARDLETETLEREIANRRDQYDRMRESGADPEDLEEARRAIEEVAALRGMRERLEAEAAQIDELTRSNDPASLQRAAERRTPFEEDYARYRAIMRGDAEMEPPAPAGAMEADAAPVRRSPEQDSSQPAPEATPPTAERPTAGQAGQQDIVDAPQEAPARQAPAADPAELPSARPPEVDVPAQAVTSRGAVGETPASAFEQLPPGQKRQATRQHLDDFMAMTQPVQAGATVTDLTRALSLVNRAQGLDDAAAQAAVRNFKRRMNKMRQEGRLAPGDTEAPDGRIIDRAAEEGGPRALTTTEAKRARRLRAQIQRENPDMTPEDVRLTAEAQVMNMRAEGRKSRTASNAARMEAMAPADPRGRGTRSVPIGKGSEYGVDRRDFVGKKQLNLEAAKIAAHGSRGDGMGLVPFSAQGTERAVGIDGRPRRGQELWYDAVSARVYSDEDMARRARGEMAPIDRPMAERPASSGSEIASDPATPVSRVAQEADDPTRQPTLQDLLARFDPEGDGSGDATGFVRALRELNEGRAPDLTPDDALPPARGDAGGLLIARSTTDPSDVRMMSPGQAARGATLRDIIGKSPDNPKSDPANWEVRYTPPDTQRSRSPDRLREIFEQSSPAETAPGEAIPTNSLTIEEASGIRLTLDEADVQTMAALGHGDLRVGDEIELPQLLEAIHRYEAGGWDDVAVRGGPGAYAQTLADAYAMQARVNPEGTVLPAQTRSEAIEAAENIFGRHSPEEMEGAVRLLKRLGSSDERAPIIRMGDQGVAGGRLETNYLTGQQEIVLNNNLWRPRALTLYHEVGHWAYWNILTPNDRAEFWSAMSRYMDEDGNLDQAALQRGIPATEDASTGVAQNNRKFRISHNQAQSPQEFFATQFEVWAARKLNGEKPDALDGVLDQGLWKRLVGYIEALYNRYVRGVEIDPNLERLFSKILPEEERLNYRTGVVRNPETPSGKAIQNRLEQTKSVRAGLEEAISRDSADGIITAYQDAVRHLLSMAPKGGENTGVFAPMRPLIAMIRQRVDDFDQIVTGRRTATGDESLGLQRMEQEGLTVIDDPQAVADQLIALFRHGYGEGGIVPEGGVPPRIKRLDKTSMRAMLEIAESALVKSYNRAEGGAPAGSRPKTRPDPEDAAGALEEVATAAKTARTRKARVDKATDRAAKRSLAAKGKKKPAKSKQQVAPSARRAGKETDFDASLRTQSLSALRKMFRDHRGTEDNEQAIAAALLAKQRAEPLPFDPVSQGVERRTQAWYLRDMNTAQLEVEFLDALREGNTARINEAGYALQFRAQKKKGQGGRYGKPPLRPTHDHSIEAIDREIADNTGTPIGLGIPPNARASVREMLSAITHRDPEIEYASRTLAYRMINLLGRTSQNALDDTPIISSTDLARLANIDESSVPRAAFVDFRGDDFKTLRTQMRKTAIALQRGGVDPFDLVHEIGHMIMRSGILPENEITAIRQMYAAADDPVKERVIRSYAARYADRPNREELMAEEWMAEHLALYTGERELRGDIFAASSGGDTRNVAMRGNLDRAIDRVIEYTAYLLNGLIGNNTIRQQMRRLTFYGDMFERGASRTPLADGPRSQIMLHPSRASAHASDVFVSSPRARQDAIMAYTRDGVGFDSLQGEPITFYHGTNRGDRLRRENDPDAILMPSRNGQYGPGIYITENPNIADTIYARRPTVEALRKQIMDRASDTMTDNDMARFDRTLEGLHETRKALVSARAEYREKLIELDKQNDPITEELIIEDIGALRGEIDEMIDIEQRLLQSAISHGLDHDPVVLPLYVRMRKPADFQYETTYQPDSEFIRTLGERLVETGDIDARAMSSLMDDLQLGPIRGNNLYHMLTQHMARNKSPDAAKVRLNGVLEEMGYDGLVTTHVNHYGDGSQLARDGIAYAGEPTRHRALVMFDPANVKHIEASDFNAQVPGLYYREMMPAGSTGHMATEIIDNAVEGISGISPARVGESIEARGGSKGLASAAMSMLRKRPLNDIEERALLKSGPTGWIATQAQQMAHMGMHSFAPKYQGFFPRANERFARHWMPLRKRLQALPDAKGRVNSWFTRSTAGIGQKQPASHDRIVRALRFGEGSRQEKALSSQERQVWNDVRTTMRTLFNELRAAGIQMGDLGRDYLPQVWRKKAILDNKDEFLNDMAYYYQLEQTSAGQVPDQTEANSFAERMYLTLAGEDADGVFIPGSHKTTAYGGSRRPDAENIDFNRMIRLDKYPAAMRRMEKYLENDLEGILAKYIEAGSRRLEYTERFGANGHAFYDYMNVMQEGTEGIAQLLSRNKEFRRKFQYINEQGQVEDGMLHDVTNMPFESNEAGAREFAAALVQAHDNGGAPSARTMLQEVAPRNVHGEIPIAYKRRMNAITDALDDFKGRPARAGERELQFAENAMRVLMKKRQMGTSYGAAKFSNTVRTFNNVSLLGFTTLTSLSEPVLPLLRSGSMKNFVEGYRQWATDPHYREMIFNTGVAIESFVHDRMIHMYGGADDKFSQAFFNATLLTPWTDTTRQLAGAVGYESMKSMQRRAFHHHKPGVAPGEQSRDYKIADRFLRRYGLQDFLPNGKRAHESLTNRSLMDSDDVVRTAIVRFADESAFVPNPNDIPLWAQTPIGKLLFQLKSFPLMMGRLSADIVRELNAGNPMPAFYMATMGPAFGAFAMTTKDIIQMRGGEDGISAEPRPRNKDRLLRMFGYDADIHGDENDFLGWYFEGMLMMGGLGLVGEILFGLAEQAESGAYGQIRAASLIGGPTVGAGFQAYESLGNLARVARGQDDTGSSLRSSVREATSRVPVVGGHRFARESIVDAVAGEVGQRGWAQPHSQPGWAQDH